MARLALHILVILVLTVVTQLGGFAWLLALAAGRGMKRLPQVFVFLISYAGMSLAAVQIAPHFGRQPVPCFSESPVVAPPLFCVLNRTYVAPELAVVLDDLAVALDREHPGSKVTVLDGGAPFLDGFPLLPHLSHDDGQKVDLAFWYVGDGLRSPLGYWAFEDGPSDCPASNGLTLRWNMSWFQPFVRDLPLDEARTASAVRWLAANLPEGGKLFIEPHLADRLGANDNKIRFQGCRAARHDDHIHIQL